MSPRVMHVTPEQFDQLQRISISMATDAEKAYQSARTLGLDEVEYISAKVTGIEIVVDFGRQSTL